MAFKRYPHSAVISYTKPGTYTTLGVYTPGTITTLAIVCNVQPNSGRYIVSPNGDRIDYENTVFTPLVTATIPDNATLTFNSRTRVIKQLNNYQTHTEIKA